MLNPYIGGFASSASIPTGDYGNYVTKPACRAEAHKAEALAVATAGVAELANGLPPWAVGATQQRCQHWRPVNLVASPDAVKQLLRKADAVTAESCSIASVADRPDVVYKTGRFPSP
jgi:hypothetical protein